MFHVSDVLSLDNAYAAKLVGAVVVFYSLVTPAVAAWQSPLSETEQAQAEDIALILEDSNVASNAASELGQRQELAPPRRVLGAVTDHPLGLQVLLSELRETKYTASDGSRQVEVFLFDYEQGVTLLKMVDVERRSVLSTTVINSAHLPLTDAEIQYARSLLQNHSALQNAIANELNKLPGNSTATGIGVAHLQARISVWVPSTDNVAQSGCAVQRCALVSLFTNDDYSLSVEPVVNLSSGKVYLDLFQ